MNLLVVELRRAVHRRIVRWMLLLAVALCVVAGIVAFAASGDFDETSRNPTTYIDGMEHTDPDIARLSDLWREDAPDSSVLTPLLLFLAVGAFVCGASVVGAEWKAGTIVTTLTWEPRRVRLLVARLAACGIWATVLTLALIGVFVLAILPNALVNGDTSGLDGEWWAGFLGMSARIAVIGGLAATFGAAIASLGRNTTAAIVVIFAYFMVAENMVRGLWPRWQNFLIGESVPRFVTATPLEGVDRYTRSTLGAVVLISAYVVILSGAAAFAFARRDVT
ncbi:MAG TPA: hypothetical protein VFZ83_10895 [Acidimicrobiia bacterium]|nr:hypothetical protein [Acidimicrobiia bacterium]